MKACEANCRARTGAISSQAEITTTTTDASHATNQINGLIIKKCTERHAVEHTWLPCLMSQIPIRITDTRVSCPSLLKSKETACHKPEPR